MQPLSPKLLRLFQIASFSISLGVLLFYSYARLYLAPVTGLTIDPRTGEVLAVSQPGDLLPGDRILQVGRNNVAEANQNTRQPIFEFTPAGQPVEIIYMRNGQRLVTHWVYPALDGREFRLRLAGSWWLAYPFWLVGTLVMLLVRPRDLRWLLLILSNYLTATWLSAGTLSFTHMFESGVVMRLALWLAVPVVLHLHWIFPAPFRHRLNALAVVLYLAGLVMALGELFQWWPPNLYLLAALLQFGGSVVLLALHGLRQKTLRPDLGLLALAAFLVPLPTLGWALGSLINRYPMSAHTSMLVLPVLPITYFYLVYRRQLGGLELRANRLLTLIVYSVLLFSIFIPIFALLLSRLTGPLADLMSAVVGSVVVGLGSLWLYPRFERWFEQKVLGIPLPPAAVLQTYTARALTSLEIEHLAHLLTTEILPSFLIRQALILRTDLSTASETTQRLQVITRLNISDDQIPRPADLLPILELIRRHHYSPDQPASASLGWVRLALPLNANQSLIGVCLLGRRDPDDIYSPAEIPFLQTIMDQTALGLLAIEQSERLRLLYRSDIERAEQERKQLAMELHDDVLSQFAILANSVDERQAGEQFQAAYETSVNRVRELINGLWPAMLKYGLPNALEELADEVGLQVEGRRDREVKTVELSLDCPDPYIRYPEEVELHVYRITQQACRNALRRGRPRRLWIEGRLVPEEIRLTIRDDGQGFLMDENSDLAWLLEHKHFGLASMHERAGLIGAVLEIQSSPSAGTRVTVSWTPAAARVLPTVTNGSPTRF